MRGDTERADWTAVASYGAKWEVELPRQHLEEEGIPVLVKGDESGIWGPAFAGPTSRGITLLVPAARVDEAKVLLDALSPAEKPPGTDEEERPDDG
jgi:hypothetical protein